MERFPVLELPNELIFKVLTQVTRVQDLVSLLQVKEIRHRVDDTNFLLITDRPAKQGDEVAVFREVEKVPKILWSCIADDCKPDHHAIVLVEFSQPLNLVKEQAKLKRVLKNTRSFIYISETGSVDQEARNAHSQMQPEVGHSVGYYDAYPFFRALNVCSVYVEKSTLCISLLMYDGVFDTDNIHYGITTMAIHSGGALALKHAPGANVEIGSLPSMAVLRGTEVKFDQFSKMIFQSASGSLFFGITGCTATQPIYRKYTGRANMKKVLFSTKDAELTPVSHEITDMCFNNLRGDAILNNVHRVENVSLPEIQGTRPQHPTSMHYVGFRTLPQNMFDSERTLKRPVIKNVSAPKARMLKLDVDAWFPEIDGLHIPSVSAAIVTLNRCKGVDMLAQADANRDFKFFESLVSLDLRTSLWFEVLSLAKQFTVNLAQLVLQITGAASTVDGLHFPNLIILQLYSDVNRIPHFDAPKLLTLGVYLRCSAVTSLESLTHYKTITCLDLADMRAPAKSASSLRGWPRGLVYDQLMSLTVDATLFRDQRYAVPPFALPSLVKFAVRGYVMDVFGSSLDSLNAPNMSTLRVFQMPKGGKYTTNDIKTHELLVKDRPHLKLLDLTGIGVLTVSNCPVLEEIKVDDAYSLRELILTEKIPTLKKVSYFSNLRADVDVTGAGVTLQNVELKVKHNFCYRNGELVPEGTFSGSPEFPICILFLVFLTLALVICLVVTCMVFVYRWQSRDHHHQI